MIPKTKLNEPVKYLIIVLALFDTPNGMNCSWMFSPPKYSSNDDFVKLDLINYFLNCIRVCDLSTEAI